MALFSLPNNPPWSPDGSAGISQPAAEVAAGCGSSQRFAVVRVANPFLNPLDEEHALKQVFQLEVVGQLLDGFEDLGFGRSGRGSLGLYAKLRGEWQNCRAVTQ